MTPKRIVLITYGSRGDVEPFVALGAGLVRAGYPVRLVAPQVYAGLAQAHGVELQGLPGDPQQLALSLTDRAGTSFPRQVARMVEHVFPLAASVFTALEAATADANLVIHSFLMVDAGHTLGAPVECPGYLSPVFPRVRKYVLVPRSRPPGSSAWACLPTRHPQPQQLRLQARREADVLASSRSPSPSAPAGSLALCRTGG